MGNAEKVQQFMSKELTKNIAFKELQGLFNDKPFVLFGTGMSIAVNDIFGMNALKENLLKEITQYSLSKSQKEEWSRLEGSLANDSEFESAMNNIKDNQLITFIVEQTGKFIAKQDFIYSQKILTGEIIWPASTLFKKLVEGLPGTDRELHVATPNYDLLAESAFFKNGIPYNNGFFGSLYGSLDWEQSKRAITYADKTVVGKKQKTVIREKKHIAFYKVHGSLNLFLLNDNLIENNSWVYNKPKGIERLIITPGISKYEKLHKYRSELLGKYDNAIEKHNFFLFLGFGFNNNQLNTNAILDKLKNKNSNGLIITRNSNSKIENLLKESKNLWLICSTNDKNGTIIKNSKFSKKLILNNNKLWEIDIFTRTVLGE